MPLIECKSGAVTENVAGTMYSFQKDKFGRFVCEVHDLRHVACFLSIPKHYQQVEAEAPLGKFAKFDHNGDGRPGGSKPKAAEQSSNADETPATDTAAPLSEPQQPVAEKPAGKKGGKGNKKPKADTPKPE